MPAVSPALVTVPEIHWPEGVRMNHKVNPKVFIVVVSLLVAITLMDPSGKLLDSVVSFFKRFMGSVIGLVFLGIVVLGLIIWVGGLFRANPQEKHPDFFEEMQSTLRSILIPLGFDEKAGWGVSNLTNYVDFTQGDFAVAFWLDRRDSIYHLDVSSRSEVVNNEKRPVPDFSIECASRKETDEFKSNSMAKLDAWLVKQNLR
jgi:hypothetical protein